MTSAKLFINGGSQVCSPTEESLVEGKEGCGHPVEDEARHARVPADAQAMIDALSAFAPGTKLQREQPPAQDRTESLHEFERVPALRIANWALGE